MRFTTLNGLALMATLGFTGCATSTAANRTPPADAQAAEDQAAAELKEHHWHHHRGGVTQFIAMGIDTLGVDDARLPRVETLQDDLYACMAPAGEVHRKLDLLLADGIAAGAIDAARVDAQIAELGPAAAERHCAADALNQLHAILTPAERSELAEKVQAHWEVWHEANHQAAAGGREPGGRLARLGAEVSLTPAQIEAMSAALASAHAGHTASFDRKELESHVMEFAATFPGESFDARTFTAHANDRFAVHGAKRMAIFYETVTPFLAPAQRATLAGHLRQHASQNPTLSAK